MLLGRGEKCEGRRGRTGQGRASSCTGPRGGMARDLSSPVVVLLKDIRDVNVEEEKVRYFGKGYSVVLRFVTGFSHPLTQSAIMGHRR